MILAEKLEKQDEGKEKVVEKILFKKALSLYRKQKLSLGKAAELAGYERMSFIKKLQQEGETIFDYDSKMIDEMIDSTDMVLKLVESSNESRL